MCRDTNKFLELLKPEYNNALRYCRALCAGWSPDDAEDVLQQSLLRALESFESLIDLDKFRSWFFKIITRVFYSSIRKHFWKRFVPLDRNTIDIPEIFPRNEYNEERILLDNALSKLSAKERAAVLLYEIAGFSIEEIQHLQKENSLSAVKSRLSRARQKLRRHIKELENKGRNTAGAESQNKYFRGSEGFRGDIENETIKLVAELKAKE